MNNVNLIGNLVRDPELKMLPNLDKAVATFTLAVKRPFKANEVDYINIVTYGATAENCAKYLAKGSKAAVTGYLQIRSFEAKDGTRRYVTEVPSNTVEFLSPKPSAEKKSSDGYEDMEPVDDSEDIPF